MDSFLIIAVCLFHLIFLKEYLVSGDGIEIADCKTGCACCKDQVCGPNGHLKEGNCYHGCIDGYHGARCYQKCTYNCPKCNPVDNCTSCYDGYYPGPNNNCTTQCPTVCERCTSRTNCTTCKDGYYNANGHRDCRFRRCPLHCKCEQNVCVSCEAGYYDTSSECTSKCPFNCVTCSSGDSCDVCQDGYYRGYEFGSTNNVFLSNCSHKCRDKCTRCSSYKICLECEPGMYGATCQNECSVGCESRFCHNESGNCDCKANFSGNKCIDCVPGQYGPSCEETCSEFCLNKHCEKRSGRCVDGCLTSTITGDTCNACQNGWYGDFCNATCPKSCKNDTCDRDNGTCSNGCKDNFNGTMCENCLKGNHGETCSRLCPDKCKDGICDKDSGYCFACSGNYEGNECNSCKAGLYGPTCNEECSAQCLNATCDRATGDCDLGCKSSFSGDKCCIKNAYCLHCMSDTECSKCQPRYFSERCNEMCSPNCADSCDRVTGICNSCKSNLYGQVCHLPCPTNCKQSQDVNNSRCESKGGNCLYGCVDGYFGLQCNEKCNSGCIGNECFQLTGKCSKGCDKPSDDPACDFNTDPLVNEPPDAIGAGPVVGGVVGLITLTVGVIVAVVLYKRRCAGKTEECPGNVKYPELLNMTKHTYGNRPVNGGDKKQPVKASSSVVNIGDLELDKRAKDLANKTDQAHHNIEQNNRRVNVNNLLTYVANEHVDSFETEFMKLNKSSYLTRKCNFARKQEDIKLNRFNEIYPYDNSRVTVPGQPEFFINARYIGGYNRRKAYIVSLGPTAQTTNTFPAFLGMVWNEKSDIIVILTNLREVSGKTCEQYWPIEEKETAYGQIKMKCRSIEVYAEYTIRTFTMSKGKDQRNILQLHYTAWPDKRVPKEVTSLIEFLQRVKAVPVILGGPVIVLCSAGVGRTGIYIALDQLTEEGKNEGSVDVFKCVHRIREQRLKMVHTAEQYEFLHKALVHSLSFGCEAMTAEQIQAMVFETNNGMFTNMYQTLRQEVDIACEEDIEARQENRKSHKHKNRRQSDIPGDSSRVRLYLSRKDGHHDYINAVFINSFSIKDMFIVAQSPLPGTVEDFLSMIYQQNSSCVVALEDPHKQNKDVGKYLPADNETYTFGNYTVRSSKCETTTQYVLKELFIQNEKGEEKTVSHFQYKNWRISKKIPDSVEDFVQFIKEVENCTRKQNDDTPQIVVHCLNGYGRSGLFCVVYTLLEKLEAERQVSVVNTVRKVRTHRKQSITSVEQLKFCFQCISAYMEIYNTYSNFAT